MRRIRAGIALIFIAAALLFTSCGMFVTKPNPLIGCYKVVSSQASDAALFYYSIEENGYYALVQAGGLNSSTPIIFEGVWEIGLSHFDFFSASGTLKLHVTSVHNAENTYGLALSYADGNNINPFTFVWELDGSTGVASLVLESQNEYLCRIPETGYTISEQEFERATGLEFGNPEPENPDAEEPDTEEPDTEEPDTEDPDTEDPDTEEPDTEDPDTEDPDTEDPDTETPTLPEEEIK